METTERRRHLFTPHTRSLIYRTIKDGKQWHGTRQGVRIRVAVTNTPDLEGNRVEWSAIMGTLRTGRRIERGRAQDVRAALESIEREAAR